MTIYVDYETGKQRKKWLPPHITPWHVTSFFLAGSALAATTWIAVGALGWFDGDKPTTLEGILWHLLSVLILVAATCWIIYRKPDDPQQNNMHILFVSAISVITGIVAVRPIGGLADVSLRLEQPVYAYASVWHIFLGVGVLAVASLPVLRILKTLMLQDGDERQT